MRLIVAGGKRKRIKKNERQQGSVLLMMKKIRNKKSHLLRDEKWMITLAKDDNSGIKMKPSAI